MPRKRSIPNITESRPSRKRMRLLGSVAQDAADYLAISLDADSPEDIVASVNDCVRALRRGETSVFPADERHDLLLGCLWGSQLIRAFGWEWANIVFHDHGDSEAVGVVSPKRDVAIYPCHFIYGCIANKATVTIALSFNMLKEGTRIPTFPEYSYENVMDHVCYIVPPDD